MPRTSPRSAPTRQAGPHVSLLALPDAVVSTLAGIYDVMKAPALVGGLLNAPGRASF